MIFPFLLCPISPVNRRTKFESLGVEVEKRVSTLGRQTVSLLISGFSHWSSMSSRWHICYPLLSDFCATKRLYSPKSAQYHAVESYWITELVPNGCPRSLVSADVASATQQGWLRAKRLPDFRKNFQSWLINKQEQIQEPTEGRRWTMRKLCPFTAVWNRKNWDWKWILDNFLSQCKVDSFLTFLWFSFIVFGTSSTGATFQRDLF